jgi:hypothetical protein
MKPAGSSDGVKRGAIGATPPQNPLRRSDLRWHRRKFLTLEPKQSGPSINFFVYPYVEVDGRQLQAATHFSFQDVSQ